MSEGRKKQKRSYFVRFLATLVIGVFGFVYFFTLEGAKGRGFCIAKLKDAAAECEHDALAQIFVDRPFFLGGVFLILCAIIAAVDMSDEETTEHPTEGKE